MYGDSHPDRIQFLQDNAVEVIRQRDRTIERQARDIQRLSEANAALRIRLKELNAELRAARSAYEIAGALSEAWE